MKKFIQEQSLLFRDCSWMCMIGFFQEHSGIASWGKRNHQSLPFPLCMLRKLFQQPAVEITFVDLLCVVEDFLIPLEPGEISRNAAFVGVFARLVVFRATEGHVWTGMAQRLFQKIAAELLSQHTARIIHGVLSFPFKSSSQPERISVLLLESRKCGTFCLFFKIISPHPACGGKPCLLQ